MNIMFENAKKYNIHTSRLYKVTIWCLTYVSCVFKLIALFFFFINYIQSKYIKTHTHTYTQNKI